MTARRDASTDLGTVSRSGTACTTHSSEALYLPFAFASVKVDSFFRHCQPSPQKKRGDWAKSSRRIVTARSCES